MLSCDLQVDVYGGYGPMRCDRCQADECFHTLNRCHGCSCPPHSYIHVDDFESPRQLAAYLLKLDHDDQLFMLPHSTPSMKPSASPMIGGEQMTRVSCLSTINAGRHGDLRIVSLLLMMYSTLVCSTKALQFTSTIPSCVNVRMF